MPEKMVSISDTLAGNPLIFGLILCCMFLLIIARVRQNGKFMFLILSFYRGKGIIQPFKEERLMLSAASVLLMTNFLVMIGLFGYYSIQILGFPEKPFYQSIGFIELTIFVACCYSVKLTLIRFAKFILELDKTVVLYESTHRILKLLKEVNELAPARQISVSRELTKKFEENVQGTAQQLLQHFENGTTKGEFVVVLEGLKI